MKDYRIRKETMMGGNINYHVEEWRADIGQPGPTEYTWQDAWYKQIRAKFSTLEKAKAAIDDMRRISTEIIEY